MAIPRLGEERREPARRALAERLQRMTAKTLRAKLKEPDAEVRRAATLACSLKRAREHVPDLFPLLDDEEEMVSASARSALKALTGKDFGLPASAGRAERLEAVARWRGWWEKQEQARARRTD